MPDDVASPAQDVDLAVDMLVTPARFTRWVVHHSQTTETAATWRALSILEEHGALRVGDFAILDRCSQPTATTLLRRLEDEGAVRRLRDPSDGRALQVSLSEAGHARLRELRASVVETLAPELEQVSEDDLETLRRAMSVMKGIMNTEG